MKIVTPFLKKKNLIPFFFIALLITACKTLTPEIYPTPTVAIEKNISFPEEEILLNLGTGIPVLFTENPFSNTSSVKYVGRSLGSAAFSFTNKQLSIVLNEDRLAKSPVTILEAYFSNTNRNTTVNGKNKEQAKTQLLIGNDPNNWKKELVNFSAIAYEQLYEGVNLTYTANGRILKSSLNINPNVNLRQIKWNYANVESIQKDEQNGIIKFSTNQNNQERGFTLGKPIAIQNGKSIAISYQYDKEGFSFVLSDYDPKQALNIEFELMFSRHFENYNAAKSSDGSFYVTGTTMSPLYTTSQEIQKDIFLAHLDREKSRILSSSFIGGAGNDEGLGIFTTDDLIGLTGRTDSRDFPIKNPIQRTLKGGYDAFFIKVSAQDGTILSSTYLGGKDDDSGEAILQNKNGNFYISGKASLNFLPGQRPLLRNYTSLFPDVTRACPLQTYYLGELTPEVDKISGISFFEAPTINSPLAIWLDAKQEPVIGISVIPKTQSSCVDNESYEMSHYQHPDFDTDPYIDYGLPPYININIGGWGFHALRWKAISAGGGHTYDPANASNVPNHVSACGDEALLNIAEQNAFTPSDPDGSWECNSTTSVDGLALAAAYYMYRWTSPIYAGAQKVNDALYGTYHYQLAIEKVDYCIMDPFGYYNASDPAHELHNLCDFDNVSPGSLTVPCALWGPFYYEPTDIHCRIWGLPLVHYISSTTKIPHNLSDNWYLAGDYVGDPPENERHLLPLIQDASDQLQARMIRQFPLVATTHFATAQSRPVGFPCYIKSNAVQYD